ncbi:MAG: alpha/beta hydrolase [Polyangiaceae bacterium]|nr:alpha/beta hydrolase [Polyangiaceae bacterium]MCB9607443.1 alpha/beta hydrolase [Polyangiaceae bacterium]
MQRLLTSLVLVPLLALNACSSSDSSGTSAGGMGGSAGSDSGGAASGGAAGASGSAATGGTSSAGTSSGGASSGGTSNGGTGGVDPYADLYLDDLTLPAASPAPFDVPDGTEFYSDIPYGTDARMRFDLFKPAAAAPTPIVVFIHGGGFTGGSKDQYGNSDGIRSLLNAGVAYASLEYRVLDDVDSDGVIKCLSDNRRALKFIRYHASELNLNATKVVLRGGSAGAGTSLWLGFHDDMARPDAESPVEHESTRVLGVIANSTQATYDLLKWQTVVFAPYNLDLVQVTEDLGMEQRLLSFYGMQTIDELPTPAITAYRAEVDMLGLMSSDDPPFWVHNTLPEKVPTTVGSLYHHPYHARALMDRATEVGVESVGYIDALGVADASGETEWQFALRRLQ